MYVCLYVCIIISCASVHGTVPFGSCRGPVTYHESNKTAMHAMMNADARSTSVDGAWTVLSTRLRKHTNTSRVVQPNLQEQTGECACMQPLRVCNTCVHATPACMQHKLTNARTYVLQITRRLRTYTQHTHIHIHTNSYTHTHRYCRSRSDVEAYKHKHTQT